MKAADERVGDDAIVEQRHRPRRAQAEADVEAQGVLRALRERCAFDGQYGRYPAGKGRS
jgi:hypothetical protein